ncbi:MAG: hypothetical protein KDD43_16955, partial [Bdellovibrionales bacterium]|nr:hypothetical protein [Bdellovibrionales bacterium]
MKSQTPVEFGSSSDLSASVERRTIVGSFVAGLSIAIVALFLSDVALGEETDGVLKCLKSISSLGTETVSNGDYRGPDNLFITRLSGGDYVVVEKNQKFFRCKNESAPKGRGEAYKLIVSPDLVLFTHRASKVQAPASQLDIDVSGAPIEVRYYVGRTRVYGDYYGQGRPVYGKMTLSHHPIECQMWESKPA